MTAAGSATEEAVAPVTVGDLSLDVDTRECRVAGAPISLTTVEFDLLLALARAAGRVKSRERLLVETAERDFEAFDRSIDVHISSIRRKFAGPSRPAPGWRHRPPSNIRPRSPGGRRSPPQSDAAPSPIGPAR